MSAITIVQGEDRTINFQIKEVDASDVTTYMDLTGATEIELRAPDASTGYISFKLSTSEVTVIDSKNGIFKVKMSDTKTALLKVGSSQNIEVIIDIGAPTAGDRRIAQLLKAITVVARLYP
jgi:hypothetical protein